MKALATLAILWSTAAYAQKSDCNAPMSEPVAFVSMPGYPFTTVASADGCWLFTAVSSSSPKSPNGVAVFSRKGGKITLKRVVPVETGPAGIALTHDGKLMVAADDAYVVFLDVARMIAGKGDPILGWIDNGPNSGSVYVNTSPDDELVFVSDENAQRITVIDLKKARAGGFKQDAIIGKIPVGNAPIALTFSPDGRWLYTTSQGVPETLKWPLVCKPEGNPDGKQRFPEGAIYVVDVAKARTDPAHAVAATVPAGCSPVRLAITLDGARAFVTARNSNAVLAFDTAKLVTDPKHARIGEVPVGSSPVGIGVTADGKVIATHSNRFAKDQTARQELTVIDGARAGEGKAAVLGTIPAGIFPREVGLSPDKKTLFVGNFLSSELEVIDLARLAPKP